MPEGAALDAILAADPQKVLAALSRLRAPVNFGLDAAAGALLLGARRKVFDTAVATAKRVQTTNGNTTLEDEERAALRAFILLFARPTPATSTWSTS